MPLYKSNIESHDDLQYVISVVEGFNQDRFLSALMGKKSISTEQLEGMRIQLCDVTTRLDREYLQLSEFGKTFNDKFTTYNNDCFSSALALLRKVRSGMSFMIKIYRSFAPKNTAAMRAANPNVKELEVYSRSAMAGAEYTMSLFEPEDFAPEVQSLYETMKGFMNSMNKCLKLCDDILTEEDQIRKDPQACLERYNIFKEKHRRRIKDMLNSINLKSRDFLEENNPAIRLRNQSKDEKEFSQKGYHVLSVPATTVLASKEIVEEAMRGDFSHEELLLFSEDREKIYRIRCIISHFDDYLPEKHTRQHIPATHVACLMAWSQATEDLGFVRYFAATYSKTNGSHKPPSNSAVNQAKRPNWERDEYFSELISQWESVEIA